MKKKILALVSAAILATGILASTGCVKTKMANFEVPEGGFDTTKQIEIEFYSTQGENLKTVTDKHIAEFQKLYPNITVNHTKLGDYNDVRDQIKTELNAGNQPNLAYCYPDHVATYNIAKAVVQMDNLIASDLEVTREDGTTEVLGLTDEQKADFIEGYYNEGAQFGDELMYTLPFSKSTEVLYINQNFFAGYGYNEATQAYDVANHHDPIPVPTHWWCGDDCEEGCKSSMEEVCKTIKAIDPHSIPLGYDSESNWFITMCEQLGTPYTSATGDHYLFNNADNKAFVKKFADWYEKGYVTTQEIYGQYTSGLFVSMGTEVVKSYMSIGSSAGATHQRPDKGDAGYPFMVDIKPIPQADADKPKAISQGPSVCIFKSSDPQEVLASWLLLKYLTTNVNFQAEFSQASGYVPVLKSVKEHAGYAAKLEAADGGDNIAFLSAKVCLEQVDSYYASPAFDGSSKARDQVGDLMQKVFKEPARIDELFEDAIDECEY